MPAPSGILRGKSGELLTDCPLDIYKSEPKPFAAMREGGSPRCAQDFALGYKDYRYCFGGNLSA